MRVFVIYTVWQSFFLMILVFLGPQDHRSWHASPSLPLFHYHSSFVVKMEVVGFWLERQEQVLCKKSWHVSFIFFSLEDFFFRNCLFCWLMWFWQTFSPFGC